MVVIWCAPFRAMCGVYLNGVQCASFRCGMYICTLRGYVVSIEHTNRVPPTSIPVLIRFYLKCIHAN